MQKLSLINKYMLFIKLLFLKYVTFYACIYEKSQPKFLSNMQMNQTCFYLRYHFQILNYMQITYSFLYIYHLIVQYSNSSCFLMIFDILIAQINSETQVREGQISPLFPITEICMICMILILRDSGIQLKSHLHILSNYHYYL